MNAKARELGLRRHAFRAAGRARRERRGLERCRRREARRGGDAQPDDQADRRGAHGDHRRRPPSHDLGRPARHVPGADRRQDRPHRQRRLVPGRGRPRRRPDRLHGDPRQPDAAAAATPTSACCSTWGLSRYRVTPLVQTRPRLRARRDRLRPEARSRSSPSGRSLRSVRLGRSFVERVTAPAVLSLPVVAGQALGEVRVYQDGRLVGSRRLVAAAPGARGRASPSAYACTRAGQFIISGGG